MVDEAVLGYWHQEEAEDHEGHLKETSKVTEKIKNIVDLSRMGDLTGINDQRLRENETFVSLGLDNFPVVFLMADIVKCEFFVLAQENVMSLFDHLIFGQIDILFLQVILVHKSMIEISR